jgi:hypothetical protein
MLQKRTRNVYRIQLLFAVPLFFLAPTAKSAELKPDTVRAWDRCVKRTEQRIESELNSDKGFLIMDFQEKDQRRQEREKLLSGGITLLEMKDSENEPKIEIPDGKIHHWRGAVFIPKVDLDFVMSRLEDPESADMFQEDVLKSKVLERFPGGLRLFLKLQRSKIVTVVYNTEHTVHFRRLSPMKASSDSVATKIAEVERFDGGREKEKPEGNDHGFLWRMNSYWRYEQTDGGVIMECESLTLSRTIPRLLAYMISPIINRIAKESLQRTLESTRTRFLHDAESGGIEKNNTASAANSHE